MANLALIPVVIEGEPPLPASRNFPTTPKPPMYHYLLPPVAPLPLHANGVKRQVQEYLQQLQEAWWRGLRSSSRDSGETRVDEEPLPT